MRYLKLMLALALVLVAVFAFASCDCEEHNFVASATVEATCTAGGSVTYTCSECDATYTEYTSRLDHTYTDKVVEATCTELGYTEHTCACGRSFKDTYTAAKGHNYTETVVKATCGAEGYTEYTCSACGDSYKTDVTAKLAHTYEKKEDVAPACGQMGYTLYACSCGESYKADFVAALREHNFVATTVEATHAEDGYTEHVCTCGSSYKTDIVPAIGHTYTTVITDPTCTEDGKNVSTCTCGDVVTVVLPATGHKVLELIENKPVDCGVDGYIKYKCVCGETIEEAIPGTGHAHKVTEYIPGSCADGHTTYTCSCGDTYTEVNPATGTCVYAPSLRALTDVEKKLNPGAIGREQWLCYGCGDEGKLGKAVYEWMTFEDGFDVHKNLSTSKYPEVDNGMWVLKENLYITDKLHLVSAKNSALKKYTISFDFMPYDSPANYTYDITQTDTWNKNEKAKPPIFFALIDGQNKWDYKSPALGLDKTSMSNDGYELILYNHSWTSLPSAKNRTDFFMQLGELYSIKMDFVAVLNDEGNPSSYKVTLSAKRADDENGYTILGTYSICANYGNDTSYIYFDGKINLFDNFKITADFNKDTDPANCAHNYQIGTLAALNDGEKKKNPNAIGRVATNICTECGDEQTVEGGDAVYCFLNFNTDESSLVNYVEDKENIGAVSSAGAIGISDNRLLSKGNALLANDLSLGSATAGKLSNYTVSFDFNLSVEPTIPVTGIPDETEEGKGTAPSYFFAISSGWQNKIISLVLDMDTKKVDSVLEETSYKLALQSHKWTWDPQFLNETLDYYITMGKDYSIKLEVASTASPRSNKCTVFIKESGDSDYTNLGTYSVNPNFGEGTHFAFNGSGNTYDNLAVTGAFTEWVDPETCNPHAYYTSGLKDLTSAEKAVNPYAIGRAELTCSKCGATALGDALYVYMDFNTVPDIDSYTGSATYSAASTKTSGMAYIDMQDNLDAVKFSGSDGTGFTMNGDGKLTMGSTSGYAADHLCLISKSQSKLQKFTISFDIIHGRTPDDEKETEGNVDSRSETFFALSRPNKVFNTRATALLLAKNEDGAYELKIQGYSNTAEASKYNAFTGFCMTLTDEYSIKLEYDYTATVATVKISAKLKKDTAWTSCGSYNIDGYLGIDDTHDYGYLLFLGEGNVFDNFSISGAFTEAPDTPACEHTYAPSVVALTAAEQTANPNAIGREGEVCSKCGATQNLGDAVYVYANFDTAESTLSGQANTGTTGAIEITGGKMKPKWGFLLEDKLYLIGKNSALKKFSLSFDVTVNAEPKTMIDGSPIEGVEDSKAPAFFAFTSGSDGNEWNFWNNALSLNKDSTNEEGAYELYFQVNGWESTPEKLNQATNYFIKLGTEYSVKMDIVVENPESGTYTRMLTLSIKEAGAETYTVLGPYETEAWFTTPSYYYFKNTGDLFDNVKVTAPFVEAE